MLLVPWHCLITWHMATLGRAAGADTACSAAVCCACVQAASSDAAGAMQLFDDVAHGDMTQGCWC
jgi:hypothetical protein